MPKGVEQEAETITMAETQAILFDLDGTLIDTTHLILRCFDHSWEKVCGRIHAREALIETFGIPLREAMSRLLAGTSDLANEELDGPDIVERLLVEYRSFNATNHDTLAQPFPNVRPVIEELRARGYSIGVVTSKSRELARRGLRLCSLDDLVDAAVFLEDTDRHKPDPAPIRAALERLNASPQRGAYIGDSRHDIIAGRAAGVRTVAALWGPVPRAALEREGPDHLAEAVIELLDIFD
ncbi:MAG: HAD-IA family hydrolase [Blastocatellia bacterium]|nr:HAD-IA family hydrolase [Blastocatellia bacterium]